MMVPIIVVMSGTFAFSAWTGNTTAIFNSTDATVSYTQTINFIGTNASVNELTVTGDSGTAVNVNMNTASYAVDPTETGSSSSTITQSVQTSGFVPGSWIGFSVVIHNTGTATLNLSTINIGSSTATPIQVTYGSNVVNAPPTVAIPITQAFLPPVTMQDVYQNLSSQSLPTALVGAPSAPGASYGYLSPGASLTYLVYIFLPYNAGWQGSSWGFEISIPVAVSV